MKMAKASQADMDMALELVSALEVLGQQWVPCMPEAIEKLEADDESEPFNCYDDEQCGRALRHLLQLTKRASLSRVVWGMHVLLDPDNKMVDPDADTLEHHPETKANEKNAARYAKVRRGQHWSVVNGIGDLLRGDALDAAVDLWF
jgi:hypothetical protein